MTIHSLTYLAALTALVLTGCASDSTIESVDDAAIHQDPMLFGSVNDYDQITRTDYSIPNLLRQNFLTSVYKRYGEQDQQTVMPMYEVSYEPYTTSDGEQVSWNYISGQSEHRFYQTQYERFWDAQAYPYRFFAVSPAPVAAQTLTPGFVLNDKHLYIPTKYQMQTCTDGTTTEGCEPHLVAQVERRQDGRDYDHLAFDDQGNPKEINSISTSRNRYVALPFHHLTSKVRFGIRCKTIGEGENHTVEDVQITVKNKSFVVAAAYEATLSATQSMTDGSFIAQQQAGTTVTLVKVSPEAEQHGNNLDHLDTEPAPVYWFECQNGLLQLPQEGVTLSISFRVRGKFLDESVHNMGYFDGEYTTFTDKPIVLEYTQQSVYTWEKNTFYTYYINLGEFTTSTQQNPIGGEGPIWFTCVIEPWETVAGGTDIDTGLEE